MPNKKFWDKRTWSWKSEPKTIKSQKVEKIDWMKLPDNVKINFAKHIRMKKNDDNLILLIFVGFLAIAMVIVILLKLLKVI